jgi:hypothetical protein
VRHSVTFGFSVFCHSWVFFAGHCCSSAHSHLYCLSNSILGGCRIMTERKIKNNSVPINTLYAFIGLRVESVNLIRCDFEFFFHSFLQRLGFFCITV